jgi:hypothetical protein
MVIVASDFDPAFFEKDSWATKLTTFPHRASGTLIM